MSYDEIRQRLFQRRKALGMSQRALAAAMGTVQSHVSELETGTVQASAGRLLSWADVLGTPLRLASKSRRSAEDLERICREITNSWMAHLGYPPEQIAEADGERNHTLCDLTSEGWFCLDEDEQTRHPLHEAADEIAELVMFVLEHPEVSRCG